MKHDFTFYEPYSFTVRASQKKTLKRNKIKAPHSYQKLFIDFNNEQMPIDKATYMLVLEHAWLSKNPVCMIPSSDHLIDLILQSRFEGRVKVLDPEHRMFSIAVPKQRRFNNVDVRGIFVAISSHKERLDFIKTFKNDFDIESDIKPINSLDTVLTVNYKRADKPNMIMDSLTVVVSQLPLYMAQIKKTNPTEHEVLLFVLAFIIYTNAFDNVVQDRKFMTLRGADKKNGKIDHTKIRNVSEGKKIRFHFRNLVNDRFYRGKFKDCEPGSVWIPVNGKLKSVVGKQSGISLAG